MSDGRLLAEYSIADLRFDKSYALPGRPIAMMMFKTWGYIVCPSYSLAG